MPDSCDDPADLEARIREEFRKSTRRLADQLLADARAQRPYDLRYRHLGRVAPTVTDPDGTQVHVITTLGDLS